ncbi:hypothetical protein C0J52_26746 [Blattella germanica]|nr:hypothetical protein C0J52_26746 [Blattella germanica]
MFSDEIVLKTSSGSCVVKEGEHFRILCKGKSPADYLYCRIKTPHDLTSLSLHEHFDIDNESYRYYGESIKSGDCGIEIDNITDDYNGEFICEMGIQTQARTIGASIDIIIASAPKELPEILVFPNPQFHDDHADYYRENTTIDATCEVKDSRPAAKISWFINRENITDRAGKLENISSEGGLVTEDQERAYIY